MNLLHRFLALLRRAKLDREMDEELRAHLVRETEQNIARGMTPDEARCAARRAFGGLEQIKERERDVRAFRWLEDGCCDIRHAIRSLRKSPGFTAVAVISLALGIGANSAVFSVVNAILLRSLPVPNPQELRFLRWTGVEPNLRNSNGSFQPIGSDGRPVRRALPGAPSTAAGLRMLADAFTYAQACALRGQGAGLLEVLGYYEIGSANVRGRQEAFTAEGLMVTDNFFAGLGVKPALGRLFTVGDDAAGTAPIVVISQAWWQKQYALDPAVIGQTVSINGHAFTIVGVLPPGFRGMRVGGMTEFYVPMSAQPLLAANWSPTSHDTWWLHLVGRVRPGVSDAQLQAALDTIFAAQAREAMQEPKINITAGRAGPAYDQDYYRRPLMILLSVVAVVIVIACVNLAGLSLARGAARHHEFAVRAALGSGRWRIVRQSLTEHTLLAAGGAVLGLLVATWGKTGISRLLVPAGMGLRYDLPVDFAVLGFTCLVTLATVLLAGLIPALRASRADPMAGLKSRTASGAPRLRAGRLLVAAQIALTVLLVAGAGLYVRTLLNLARIHPGFTVEQLLLFRLDPRAAGLRGAEVAAFHERVQRALEQVPGVHSATLTNNKLLAHSMSGGGFFTLPARPDLTDEKHPRAHRLNISESFFDTFGIPLVLGRGLEAMDTDGATKVVVVNQTFVRAYFPDLLPIGQTLMVGKNSWQIVGVCGDANYTDVKGDAPPTVYFSYRQEGAGSAWHAVRTALPPMALADTIRRTIAAIDPNIPVSGLTTQAATRDELMQQERMFATLVSALAALAVLLCCVGLYGLLAYDVARRTGEIVVRMALGARSTDIAQAIVREALLLVALGAALGLPLALVLTRLVKRQLYHVEPHDPMTLAAVAVALIATAIFASWLPARRASRVDPMIALRAE